MLKTLKARFPVPSLIPATYIYQRHIFRPSRCIHTVQNQFKMSRKTKALVLPRIGGSFELQEIYLDEVRPDEALVEIYATGLCHTDISSMKGILPCSPPAVLGHEGKSPLPCVIFNLRAIRSITFCVYARRRRGHRNWFGLEDRFKRGQGPSVVLPLSGMWTVHFRSPCVLF